MGWVPCLRHLCWPSEGSARAPSLQCLRTPLPGLGWAGSNVEVLCTDTPALFILLGKQSLALPLTSSSFFSIISSPSPCPTSPFPSWIPFIPLPLNLLLVHLLTVTHLRPLSLHTRTHTPTPSCIFSNRLPHRLPILKKQHAMGRMAAEWVPGCQSRRSLFLQRISGCLSPSCPQEPGNPKTLAVFGDKQLSPSLLPVVRLRRPLVWLFLSVVCPCFSHPFSRLSSSPSFCLSPAQSGGRTECVCLEALPGCAPHFCPSPVAVRAVGGRVGGRWHGANQPRTICGAFCTEAGSVSRPPPLPLFLSHF